MGWARFTPYQDVQTPLIQHIDAATDYIEAVFNTYESGPIHQAILAAADRMEWAGIIFDRTCPFRYAPKLDELLDHGVIVMIDTFCRRQFDQYIILDEMWLLTGTYRYSALYDDHYASSLDQTTTMGNIINHVGDFFHHLDHSQLYTGIWPPA